MVYSIEEGAITTLDMTKSEELDYYPILSLIIHGKNLITCKAKASILPPEVSSFLEAKHCDNAGYSQNR